MNTHQLYEKILKHFDGDVNKTIKWFQTNSLLLGGVSPMEMIRRGRIEKLNKFIDNALAGNFP